MADTYEKDLAQKSSLTVSDFIRVVGSDNVSYKQNLSNVADTVVARYLSVPAKGVSSGDDLNNYTTVGTYFCNSGSIASSLSNCPVQSVFNMEVSKGNNGNYTIQTIIQTGTNPPTYYVRMLVSSTWGAWTKMPTRAEVDALTNQQQRYVDMTVTSGYITIPITGVTSESSVICTIERTATSIAQMLIAYPQPTTNKIFVYVRKATGGTPDDGTTVTINVRWSNS